MKTLRLSNLHEIIDSEDIGVKINLAAIAKLVGADKKYDDRLMSVFNVVKISKSEEFGGITIYEIKKQGKGQKQTEIIDSRIPLTIL